MYSVFANKLFHILYDLRVPSIIVILARVTREFSFIILCFFCIRDTGLDVGVDDVGVGDVHTKKKRGRVSVACHSFNVTPVPFCFRALVFGEFCFIFLNVFVFVPSLLSGPKPLFIPLLLRILVSDSKLGSDPAST